MKIIAWVSQSRLDALLEVWDATYLPAIEKTRIKWGSGGNYGVNVQNVSANTIYIETVNINAVAGKSRVIATNTDFNFVCSKLRDISILASIAGSECIVTIV